MTSQAAATAKREAQERQRQNALNTPQSQTVTFKPGDTVQTPHGRICRAFLTKIKRRFEGNNTNEKQQINFLHFIAGFWRE